MQCNLSHIVNTPSASKHSHGQRYSLIVAWVHAQVSPTEVRRQSSIVKIKKCRYLEASGCVGMVSTVNLYESLPYAKKTISRDSATCYVQAAGVQTEQYRMQGVTPKGLV